MRDPKRIPKILKQVEEVWKSQPDLRLGQLLLNLNYDFYYTEDQELVDKLKKLYKEEE